MIGPRIYTGSDLDINEEVESLRQNSLLNAAQRALKSKDAEGFNQIFARAMREKQQLDNPEFTDMLKKVYKDILPTFNKTLRGHGREIELVRFQEQFLKETAELTPDKLSAAKKRVRSAVEANNSQEAPAPEILHPQQQSAQNVKGAKPMERDDR